jgi:hypothetical protein
MDMKEDEPKIFPTIPGVISGPTKKKKMKVRGKFIPMLFRILKEKSRAIAYSDEPIDLYIEVPSKDWPRLQELVSNQPEQFVDLFKSVIVDAIPEKYPGEKKRRMNTLKKESAILDEYFSYWCTEWNFSKWPKFLQVLIAQAKENDFIINIKAKDRQKQKHMTEYCIARLHKKTIKDYKLEPFKGGLENFSRTYILDGKKSGEVQRLKQMMKNKTPSEIELLASGPHAHPHLKQLFKKLNIL